MSYITGSAGYYYDTGSSTSIPHTLPAACGVGDAVLLSISNGSNDNVASVSSSHIAWSFVGNANHATNTQSYRIWIGIVTADFAAASEVVTATWSNAQTYRGIESIAYTAGPGKMFNAISPAQQFGQTTYASAANPTTADGYSVALTTTGAGSFIIVSCMNPEDTTADSVSSCAPGTGSTLRGTVHTQFSGSSNEMPFWWADKSQSSAGSVTVYGQLTQSCEYQSSIVAVALHISPIVILQSMFWQRDSSGVSSHTVDFPLNVTPGSVIAGYLWAVYDQARTMTAFTAKSGTDTGTVVHQDTARINMAYIKNATGGATDITFTLSGTNSYDRLWAFEIAGCDTTDPYDGHNVSDDAVNFGLTTDAVTSGSITTTAAGDVLAVVGWNGNERTAYPTTGTGFISDGTWDATTVYDCTRMEHKVLGAAGSYAGTFTQPSEAANYSAAAMAFKAASGSTPRRRILFIN